MTPPIVRSLAKIMLSLGWHHRLFAGLLLSLQALSANAQDATLPASPVSDMPPISNGRVIVKFRQDSPIVQAYRLSAAATRAEAIDTAAVRATSLGSRLAITLRSGRFISDQTQVMIAEGIDSQRLARQLASEPDIEYAVEDQRRRINVVPSDPLFSSGPIIRGNSGGPLAGQWYLRAPEGEIQSSINATEAWDLTTGSASIVVGIVDTGVRPEHPDLSGRLLPGYDMISDALIANDSSGRDADASDPGDWVSDTDKNRSGVFNCDVTDSSWHGTQIASIIGANSNNRIGMTGIAWNAKLLPIRALGKCGGYDSDIIAGMYWAAGMSIPGVPVNPNPAQVINLSLGGTGSCSYGYTDAINAITHNSHPATIVVSAGNSAGHELGTPANCPGVISVTGLRHAGTKVGFSDLGENATIAAPAGNCVNTAAGEPCLYPILAATDGGTKNPAYSTYTDSFNISLGTSHAAAIVSGTVALMLSVDPTLTPQQVRTALQSSARDFPPPDPLDTSVPVCQPPSSEDQLQCHCTSTTCGAGMLDAAAAVKAVVPSTGDRHFRDVLKYREVIQRYGR